MATDGEIDSEGSLTVRSCDNVEEMGECIGNYLLTELIRLEIRECYFLKCMPNTITRLRYLKHLVFYNCCSLEELPANIGQLVSLTHLKLSYCTKIKYLPNGIANLSNLTSLSLSSCYSLVELPPNIGQLVSLTHLKLSYCPEIKYLPNGIANLSNLTSLSLFSCDSLVELPPNIGQLVSLTHLKLSDCTKIMYLPNVITNLSNLCVVDIQYSKIKCLPWSIMKLRKLRLLMLPYYFRLETLPDNLNNSLIISVKDWHVRKSWGELKMEMPKLSVQIVGEIPIDSLLYPPGYLRLEGDPSQWIINNNNLLNSVRALDLEDVEELTDSITKLSELTHLYLYLYNNSCLTDGYFVTLSRLRHLCLEFGEYGDVSIFHCLSKLSNLEYLHLYLLDVELPADITLPDSLSHLSLSHCDNVRSLVDSLKKLTNLKTLDLYECHDSDSLPNLNLDKLKLCNCSFQSLSIEDLRHLEILFCDLYSDSWGFLNQLVNLETLSITSKPMKSLPEEMSRLRNLQKLLLKDCINLRELPSNLHELVNLHTLDISITRIKSFPPCFVKPPNIQYLILPKCFNLKSLPCNLQQVSIIDDTDEAYYKSMEYDDSLYHTSADTSVESEEEETEQGVVPGVELYFNDTSDGDGDGDGDDGDDGDDDDDDDDGDDGGDGDGDETSNEGNGIELDDVKGNKERLSKESVEGIINGLSSPHGLHVTPVMGVSRCTMKRKLKDLKLVWPSRRKGKQLLDAKKRKHNNKAPFVSDCSHQNLVNPGNSAAHTKTVADFHTLPNHQEQLDNANEVTVSNTLQQNENLSNFIVKATYKGKIAKFKFSLSCSIDQLKEEVASQLKLEANRFDIMYEDEDNGWILMTSIFNLEDALKISRSNNNSVVRLLIEHQ